jgi:hypothetical protein
MLNSTPLAVRWIDVVVGFAVTLGLAAAPLRNARAQTQSGGSGTPPAGSAKSASSTQPVQDRGVPLSRQGGSTLRARTLEYQPSKSKPKTKRTITAHVVALDQPFMWNRLGGSQPNGMVYALARDIVPTDYDPKHPAAFDFADLQPGCVRLREDKRPRPLVLRVNEGDELVVKFTNLLSPVPPTGTTGTNTRYAGFHVMGLELIDSIGSDSSWVGTNPPVTPQATQKGYQPPPPNQGGEPGSTCAPGATKMYKYYARAEGTYMVYSFTADAPGSSGSQLQSGLFGVVNVQPDGAEYYRSQVLADDLAKATYYVWEKDMQPMQNQRRALAAMPSLALRQEEAKRQTIDLPKQSGVYYLDKKETILNMNLAVELDASGFPATAEIDGIKYPVYTLTTIVPAPPTQLQKRTFKTTSVVLLPQKGDPAGMLRLYLASGQQLVNFVAIYPRETTYPSGQPIPPLTGTGREVSAPVLSMLHPSPDPVHFPYRRDFELVYGDLTAIITGPGHDRWPYSTTGPLFNENPSSPDRRQPYREFTIVYHYSFAAVQAFSQLNNYASNGGDLFAINYGCAGIGAEILSNRLGVGPMGRKDAVDLKFEEFFLSSWSCGDPAMVVDVPANAPNEVVKIDQGLKLKNVFTVPSSAKLISDLNNKTLPPSLVAEFKRQEPSITFAPKTQATVAAEGLQWSVTAATPAQNYTITLDNCNAAAPVLAVFSGTLPVGPLSKQKATKAFYPDDPSNVYHSYMRDHVKFRVLNASEGITHVHHQHAHQWLHSPNSDNGQYLDSQTVVAGSGYTMEITHGGSGNLNYTVGDSIFHCHFYPHFAEGMWSLWRVHDVFEAGTKLDDHGIPDRNETWNRAYPDGEIQAGTPIPALVPMPSLAMAPFPARVRVVDHGRQVEVEAQNQPEIEKKRQEHPNDPCQWPEPDYAKSPGYPFFIPGISGHRPPHPPLDYAWQEDEKGNPIYDRETGKKKYLDGGLPRHVVLDGDVVRNYFTPWDFTKDFVVVSDKWPYDAKAGGLVACELPQEGTALELAAMRTHATRARRSYMPNGDPGNFILNGLPAVPGAPYAPPGVRGDGESNVNIRRYKAAVLQIDTVFNKKGWHFPQQRMLTLWDDVAPTVAGVRPPQPFFFRSNTDDTIEYWHTNLVPNYYEMDDFQVRTPTDVLGQHIHLVKFDVTASDGAGNGFNYEDGTFSPQEVRERIAAINAKGGIYQFEEQAPFNTKLKTKAQKQLRVRRVAEDYPLPGHTDVSLFGQPPPFQNWDGAQTTIQRFDTDPTLNNDGLDRTVRSVFTHDHFSPSTHQQAGYYAALLVEPDDSTWKIPVMTAHSDGTTTIKYEQGGSRSDGGPTSWEANIITVDRDQSYREFAFEFQDMQLAYLPGSTVTLRTPSQFPTPVSLFPLSAAAKAEINNIVGGGDLGAPIPPDSDNAIRSNLASQGIVLSHDAILASGASPYPYQIVDPKAKTPDAFDTIYPIDSNFNLYTPNMNPGWADPTFAVGSPKPTKVQPQLISFGTIGTYSLNYRNEPLPLRVAPVPPRIPPVGRPVANNPESTDLAFAYASIKRSDPDLNVQPVSFAMKADVRNFIKPGQPPSTELIDAFKAAGVTLPPTDTIVKDLFDDRNWLVIDPNAADPSFAQYVIRDPGPPLEYLYVLTQVPPSPLFAIPLSLKPLFQAGKLVPQIVAAFKSGGVILTDAPPNVSPPMQAQIVNDPVTNGWLVINPNAAGTKLTTYTVREFGPPLAANLYVLPWGSRSARAFPAPIVPLSTEAKDGGVTDLDPFTPMMRAYVNDRVQVRAVVGAHMNEHSFAIHGVNFLFEPSYTNSGFLSTHAISLSEHFEMEFTVPARSTSQKNDFADYLYAPSANAQGQTSGTWGILRAYDGALGDLGKEGSSVYLAPLDDKDPEYTAPQKINFAERYNLAEKKAKADKLPENEQGYREYTVVAMTAQQLLPSRTLYYNTRGQAAKNYPFEAHDPDNTKLENPYALVYVDADDLDNPNDACKAKLKSDMRVEPLILRANAGDWIKITLKNYFDASLATFNNVPNQGQFTAGNPFQLLAKAQGGATLTLNTSTLVGLHPQLVAYDVTAADGVNVGYNSWDFTKPVADRSAPLTLQHGESRDFYWYAGNLTFDENNQLVETPVEFGSVNLAPADPLIQHRKGLIGALVVEPLGSSWPKRHDELVPRTESEYVYTPGTGTVQSVTPVSRRTRAIATVTKADKTTFDELVLVMQTDAYTYEKNPKGVKPPPATPALVYTQGAALNYRTEPLGYRYPTPPSPIAPAGTAARLSNALVAGDPAVFTDPTFADPQTPVFTTKVGTPVRFRWIYPAGPGGDAGGSSQVPVIHGHVFQEEPYINDSEELGFNPLSSWVGGRYILPGQTVDVLLPFAGGSFRVPGDYFYGTFIGQTTAASAGVTQAPWGLFRVIPSP